MSASPKPVHVKLSLFTQKSKESKTGSIIHLTNRNWVRIMRLSDVGSVTGEIRMTESDVLNYLVETYYKRARINLGKVLKPNRSGV